MRWHHLWEKGSIEKYRSLRQSSREILYSYPFASVFHFLVKTKRAAFLQAMLWSPWCIGPLWASRPNNHEQNPLRLWAKIHCSFLQTDFLLYVSHPKKDNWLNYLVNDLLVDLLELDSFELENNLGQNKTCHSSQATWITPWMRNILVYFLKELRSQVTKIGFLTTINNNHQSRQPIHKFITCSVRKLKWREWTPLSLSFFSSRMEKKVHT